MQLLIVHDDAEVGEQLMSMVKDYTAHQCDLVESDAAALRWAREHARCGLLLAQLEGPRSMASRSVARSVKFFPGCKRFSSRHIPPRNNDSRSRKQKYFPNRSTASACWKRSKPRRRQDRTPLIFFMSWMCSKCVA